MCSKDNSPIKEINFDLRNRSLAQLKNPSINYLTFSTQFNFSFSISGDNAQTSALINNLLQPGDRQAIKIVISRNNFILLNETLMHLNRGQPAYVRSNLRLRFASGIALIVSFSNLKPEHFPTQISRENVYSMMNSKQNLDLALFPTLSTMTYSIDAIIDSGPVNNHLKIQYFIEYVFV
jgi:hypothetical protein